MSESVGSFELPATPDQAQELVDEVDRITANVKTSPGLKGIKNHSAPSKIQWHQGILFIRHPEGQSNVDDTEAINLASVSWDNPDRSRTSYATELTTNGLSITKHIYPPAELDASQHTEVHRSAIDSGSYEGVVFSAAADLLRATEEQRARVDERALGLHHAGSTEVTELLAKLALIEPVS